MVRSLGKMRRWLMPENGELARAPRQVQPEIVVHYWDGAAPEGHGLRDISETGAYILTAERWYQGTIIRIILQGHQAKTKDDGTVVPRAFDLHPRTGRAPGRRWRGNGVRVSKQAGTGKIQDVSDIVSRFSLEPCNRRPESGAGKARPSSSLL